MDPLVRPCGLARDREKRDEPVDLLVDLLPGLLHEIVPDHPHLDLAEITITLTRSGGGVKGLQSL